MPEAKRNLQNTATIAKLFGVTTRQIQKLAKAGTIPATATDPYQFDLLPTIQAYIRWLQERVDARQTKSDAALAAEGRKMAADADLKGTKAKLAELQLRELEAKMHRAEDVAAMTDDLLLVIRAKIEELPGLLAGPVTQATTAAEASAVIQAECWRVLNELAAYKYDPEDYEQRRRDHGEEV